MSSKRTADWYASCLPEPADAHAEWQDHGIAVLPLGARFEAVRIPDALAYAATESSEHRVVDMALALAFEGPLIHDSRGRNHYALVEDPVTTRPCCVSESAPRGWSPSRWTRSSPARAPRTSRRPAMTPS
ncbi:hypothetical protein [Streptomyces sp. AB3(2024)]|uniref:hypothetical protein n=1 Tax=Streptomyces sp. AB3(2024) TaxID=3317321 RepID=UPI0035A2D540